MKTRFTEIFNIQYPVMQGGMQWLGTPELAAAVSEAGGLGTINAAIYKEADEFRAAIKEMKRRTSKPFCVNFSIIPDVSQDKYLQQLNIMTEEGADIVETAGANPVNYVPFFKENRFKWIHKAPTVKHAIKGEQLGADAVALVGFEAGGHPGKDELAGNVLVRKAALKVTIPILAAGGYADGRGLIAALALGADGILMGTRFIATKECCCHDNFKKWIVNASEADTCLVQKTLHNMMRAANNETAKKCMEMERVQAPVGEILKICNGEVGRHCYENGDTNGSIFPVGQSVGLVENVPSVQELIDSIVNEATLTLSDLQTII